MKIRTIMQIVLAGIVCLAFTADLFAEEKKNIMTATDGIREVLTANTGKRVSVKTDSCEAMEGTVEKVGDQLVHISRLSGKDFYDAVVRIDRINSVVIRVKGN